MPKQNEQITLELAIALSDIVTKDDELLKKSLDLTPESFSLGHFVKPCSSFSSFHLSQVNPELLVKHLSLFIFEMGKKKLLGSIKKLRHNNKEFSKKNVTKKYANSEILKDLIKKYIELNNENILNMAVINFEEEKIFNEKINSEFLKTSFFPHIPELKPGIDGLSLRERYGKKTFDNFQIFILAVFFPQKFDHIITQMLMDVETHKEKLLGSTYFFDTNILHLLSIMGNLPLFQYFVENHKLDFTRRNHFYQTPLHFLMDFCSEEIESLKEKFPDALSFQKEIANKIKNDELLILKNYEIFNYLLDIMSKKDVNDIIAVFGENRNFPELFIFYSLTLCPYLEKDSDLYFKIMGLVERIYRLDIERPDIIREECFFWGNSREKLMDIEKDLIEKTDNSIVNDLVGRLKKHSNEVAKIYLLEMKEKIKNDLKWRKFILEFKQSHENDISDNKDLESFIESLMEISTPNNNNNNTQTVELLNFTKDPESNNMENKEENISDEISQEDIMEEESEDDVKDSKKEVEEGNSSAKSTKDSKEQSKQFLFWNKGELAPQNSTQQAPSTLHACCMLV